MSAAGIAKLRFARRTRIIGAHADYNRADFVFLRTQSPELRQLPWEERVRPLKSWSELALYSGAIMLGMVLLTALTVSGS